MDSVPSTHIVITAAGPSSQHADAIGELCASRATSAGAGLLSHIRSVRSAPARVAEPTSARAHKTRQWRSRNYAQINATCVPSLLNMIL